MEVCDGINDCLLGEDEKNCQQNIMFECKSVKQKIHVQNVCNFIPDCLDESDEKFCGKFKFTINKSSLF